jgi:hypothetical protein
MKPPWDRKRRALPRLPKGSVRVQVKVIEVGGNSASYRRSKSYTVRSGTFKEICTLMDLVLAWQAKIGMITLDRLGSPESENPTSGALTPELPPSTTETSTP